MGRVGSGELQARKVGAPVTPPRTRKRQGKPKRYVREGDTVAGIRADWNYWKELESVLPWKVHGFTYRHSCQYSTPPYGHILQIDSYQRDQIMEAGRAQKSR